MLLHSLMADSPSRMVTLSRCRSCEANSGRSPPNSVLLIVFIVCIVICVIVLLSLPLRPHFAHCARLSHATAAASALFHAAKLQHSHDLRHNQITDVAPTITCLGIFRVCFDLAARREHNATTKPTTLAIGPSINEQYDGYIRQAKNYTRIEIPFVLFCVIMRHFPNIIVKFALHIKVCCNEQTNQSAWKL